ncbi:LOW QUALITY PROTEIN: nucleoside diphosphate-linked moiety X motif 17 [Rhynchonycteris naso]
MSNIWHAARTALYLRPFPGASARPLQRPPFLPFAALDQHPKPLGIQLPTNPGVDLGVAVLQASDQTVFSIYEVSKRGRKFSFLPFSSQFSYPAKPSWDLLKFHHVILFVVSQGSQQQLQSGLEPNPSEIAFIRLGPGVAAAVAVTEDKETPRHLCQDLPHSVL